MTSAETQIANLLYLYAERIDAGDLDGAAELFRDAAIFVAGRDAPVGHLELAAIWAEHIKIHSCGTPRTKHIVTNPIIEIDKQAATARCRSSYVVLQASAGFPLQPIAAGRYHDRFAQSDGRWHFVERDYRLLDLVGETHMHLTLPLGH